MSTIRSVRIYRRDWLAGSGAQAKLLEALKPEPWVYLRVEHKDYGYVNGGISCDDLTGFLSVNRHTYEIIPTDRKRKFYLDYNHYVDNTIQSAKYTMQRLLNFRPKLAPTPRVCAGRVGPSSQVVGELRTIR